MKFFWPILYTYTLADMYAALGTNHIEKIALSDLALHI